MRRNPNPIFDSSHIKSVPVIASFDSDGNTIPIYASINGERYKLESCTFNRREDFYLYFNCSIVIDSIEKKFEMIYSISHTAWFIPVEYLGS